MTGGSGGLHRQRMPRGGSFGKNVSWLMAGQGTSIILQALYFICLARLLGRFEYGAYAGVLAMISIVSQYSLLGSGILLLRYVSPDHKKFRIYWGNLVLTTLAMGSMAAILLRLLGAKIIGPSGVGLIVPVAVGDCLFSAFTVGAGQAFQALEEMRTTAILNLLTNFMRLMMALLMLWKLHHCSAIVWAWGAMSVSGLAALFALIAVTRRAGLPILRPELLLRHCKEGVVYSVSGSTTSLYNDLDKTMLGHWGMIAANGIYTMAYRIVDICTIPVRSVQTAALPRFFRAGANGTSEARVYALKIVRRTAPIGLVLGIAAWIGAPLLPKIVGHSFQESVSALRWLCLLPFFRSFHLSAGDAITGAGYQPFRLASQSTAALLNFCLNLWLIPRHGWIGAAWASLLTDGALAVFNWSILSLLDLRAQKVSRANAMIALIEDK